MRSKRRKEVNNMYDNNFSEIDELDDDYICHWGVKGMKWKDHVYKTGEDVKEGYKSAKKLAKKTYKSVKKKIGRFFETKAQKAARLKQEARNKALAPWKKKRSMNKALDKAEKGLNDAASAAKKAMKQASTFKKRKKQDITKNLAKAIKSNSIGVRYAAHKLEGGAKGVRNKKQQARELEMKAREIRDRQVAKQKADAVRQKRAQEEKVAKAQQRARLNVNSQQNLKAAKKAAEKYKAQQDYNKTHGEGLESRQSKAVNRTRLNQSNKANLEAAARARANQKAQNAINRISSGQSQANVDNWKQQQADKAAYEKQQKWKQRQMIKKYGGR